MKPSVVVFLHSHRYDRVHQAVSLLLAASSMGWSCHLCLFYGALGSYVAGTWGEVDATAADEARFGHPGPTEGEFPSPYEMLDKARREPGRLRVYACSASCKALGLDRASVREKVDEIVGLATMLQIAENARHLLYV